MTDISTNPPATAPADGAEDGSSHARRGLPAWLKAFFRPKSNMASLLESLEPVLAEHELTESDLAPHDRTMLANLLAFGRLRVDDVMVPRADIVAVEESDTLEQVVAVFREAAHSRLPVYRETLDDPVGMFHIKDIMQLLADRLETDKLPPFALTKARRPLLFVPPSMSILDLLRKMQATRNHMALVIDEYGGTDGLVTIEDLVEEIVGDIEDEHDIVEESALVRLEDGSYEADARLPIDTLEETLGLALVPEEAEEVVDTVGGLIAYHVDRVPERGEVICYPAGVEFEILDADPRRIKKVRLRPTSPRESTEREGRGELPAA